jgi:hypothetical protein
MPTPYQYYTSFMNSGVKVLVGISNNSCVFIVLLIFLLSQMCLSQNYTYDKHLSELKLEGKMNSLCQNNNLDSITFYLSKYENRLGYKYYYFKALLANHTVSGEQINYLDSAFRRGLSIKCMGKELRLFDSAAVFKSFQLNYLKGYDEKYRAELQWMEDLDQKYRPAIGEYMDKLKTDLHSTDGSFIRDTLLYTKEQRATKRVIDSLRQLQDKFDSMNFTKWNQLIAEKGWPGAKRVGMTECFSSKLPAPAVLVMHNGTSEHYVIEYLKQVILLCLNNEDSWRNAETLIFYLYNSKRLRRQYFEFSFLEFENKKVQEVKSFFAIYQMSELLIKNPTETIEIKCKDVEAFNDVKHCMLKVNRQIPLLGLQRTYLEIGRQRPDYLSESRFLFVQDKEMEKDKILCRFIGR